MALIKLPEGVLSEIISYLDCNSLWNLSRANSKFASLRTSNDHQILSIWKYSCLTYSPEIVQYSILKEWYQAGFEDIIDYRKAFLSFQRKKFNQEFDSFLKKVVATEKASMIGSFPYGEGCHTSVWLQEAKAYQVECIKRSKNSKTYLVSFYARIVSRNYIATGSGGAYRPKDFLGTLQVELDRKWTTISDGHQYAKYQDKVYDEKTHKDPFEDQEHLLNKEFDRRTRWKPADMADVRIAVLGAQNSGKTTYVHKLVQKEHPKVKWPYEQSYLKTFSTPEGEISIEFFDSSKETFFLTTPDELCWYPGTLYANISAHRQYDGCPYIIIVDVTADATTMTYNMTPQIFTMHMRRVPCCLLLANKVDSSDRKITSEQIENFAKEHNMMYAEISALTGDNIQESFDKFLIEKLLPYKQQLQDMKCRKKPKKQTNCCVM